MIVPDVNLLLYAHVEAFAEHPKARLWWDALLNGQTEIGIAGVVLFGFLRLATHRKLFDPPMSVEAALSRVERWLARPQVRFLPPGPRHLEIAFRLLKHLGAAGDLTTDVQLAALAIEHQAEVHSNDVDFGRFPQLRWVNPLAKGGRPAKPRGAL
jgi:toxin-antitoxin system PIN domain toxin